MGKKAFITTLIGVLWAVCNQLFAFSPCSHGAVATRFELVKGMVVVQAEMDGQLAYFILDTGSSMMILNEKVAKNADYQATSLQGGMSGTWKTIDKFVWAGVQKQDMQALTTDISLLEAVTGRRIAGLIGYEFLEGFELVMDFDQLLITLLRPDEGLRPNGWSQKVEIPFSLAGHLPVIEAKIGETKLRLGLDTGANTNVLDVTKLMELGNVMLISTDNSNLIGMTGGASKTIAADIEATKIGGLDFRDMRFVFSDISHLPNLVNHQVDGLLGYPFFKSGKFSVNYATQVISIWE